LRTIRSLDGFCPEVRQSGEWRVYFVDASCKQG
jgi:hypothetical protein